MWIERGFGLEPGRQPDPRVSGLEVLHDDIIADLLIRSNRNRRLKVIDTHQKGKTSLLDTEDVGDGKHQGNPTFQLRISISPQDKQEYAYL